MSKTVLIIVLIVTLAIIGIHFYAVSQTGRSTHADCLIVRQDNNAILRLTTTNGTETEIFASPSATIGSLSVSPNNLFSAFIETRSEDHKQDRPSRNSLRVIDVDGTTTAIIEENVARYAWSPDGSKLAFVTFDPCDPDYAYRCPTGAWVHDLLASETIKIKDSMTEIFWAQFDSTLYLLNRDSVFKWKTDFPEPMPSKHRDIYFSPDGQYYLRLWKDENDPIQLFCTANDQKMNLPTDLGSLWGTHDLNPPHGWAYNSGHILLFIKEDVEVETEGTGPIQIINSKKVLKTTISLYDPSEQKTIRQFEGLVGNWIGNGDFLIIEQDGRLSFEMME